MELEPTSVVWRKAWERQVMRMKIHPQEACEIMRSAVVSQANYVMALAFEVATVRRWAK